MAREFSDEELTAYLDGEHEFAPVKEIEAALKSDARLKARVDALRFDGNTLRQSFDALLPKAPPMPELKVAPALKPRSWANGWQAAAAVALLTVGIGLGNWFSQPVQQLKGWRDYAAAYQSLYVKDTLANISPSAGDIESELKQIADIVGKPVTVAQITTNSGLSFKRAQILSFNGKPLAQIAYLTDDGEPIAFCIMKGNKAADLSFSNKQGLASASWGREGYEYLLIGGKDQKLIEEAAKKFAAAI